MTHIAPNYAAWWQGEYMTLSQVSISPLDRGFLLGDSIYEVIPCYQGKALAADEHWQRLVNGLAAVGIEVGYSIADWQAIAAPLLVAEETAQLIYVQVSRGAESSRKHRFPVEAAPTVLMFSIPFTPPVTHEFPGCAAHLQQDLRWQRCDVKSTSLMGNVLAYRQLDLDGHGQDEALLVRDGVVFEAPSSNLFMAKDGVIYTPPVNNILPGVTRSQVIALARQQGFEVREQAPDIELLKAADEVWVTNSMEELKPVITLDGQPVGHAEPGAIWRQLFNAFQSLKD